ncbi:MAG TPA: hypothetical protein VGJ41_17700, partial [Nocardioides sp.]
MYDAVRSVTTSQTPAKWTFGVQGDLHIAKRSGPVATPAPLPPALQESVDSPLAGVRAGAVHELQLLLTRPHAGRALAARQTLERLTHDDSRMVSSAAAAALGEDASSPAAERAPVAPVPAPTTRQAAARMTSPADPEGKEVPTPEPPRSGGRPPRGRDGVPSLMVGWSSGGTRRRALVAGGAAAVLLLGGLVGWRLLGSQDPEAGSDTRATIPAV